MIWQDVDVGIGLPYNFASRPHKNRDKIGCWYRLCHTTSLDMQAPSIAEACLLLCPAPCMRTYRPQGKTKERAHAPFEHGLASLACGRGDGTCLSHERSEGCSTACRGFQCRALRGAKTPRSPVARTKNRSKRYGIFCLET